MLWCYGVMASERAGQRRCYGVMVLWEPKQAGEIIQIVQNGQNFLRGATPRPKTNENLGIFSGRWDISVPCYGAMDVL